MDEIVNRVANSDLQTIDLEDYFPKNHFSTIDIKNWLFEEIILKEKEFRTQLENHDWEQYHNQFVLLTCSADAIIPSWAYLLITTYTSNYAKKTIVGNKELMLDLVYAEIINNLDVAAYTNKPVIVKGCTNKPIPNTAYTLLIEKLKPICKSIMYGEACSTVPLYKKK